METSLLNLPDQIIHLSPYWQSRNDQIVVHLGALDNGKPFYLDLYDKPHLLIIGSKRSGKTTMLHDIACSLISSYSNHQTKIIMVSGGKSGFSNYTNVPHLFSKVATEEATILSTFDSALSEIKLRKQNCPTNKQYANIVMLVDDMDNLSSLGKVKALTKVVEIAHSGRDVRFHLVIATKKIGINPLWNSILNLIDTRLVLSVSSSESMRVLGSDSASKLKTIGEGFAVGREKPTQHFMSCKASVHDTVAMFDNLVRQKQDILAQTYVQKQKQDQIFSSLDPYQFEEFVAKRMRECGFSKVTVTAKSGDYGADVLGTDASGNKTCVQCKQYTTKVGFDAIQQINTARTLFNCKRALLVTTSSVTNQARNAANQLQVEIIEHFNPSTLLS